MVSFLRCLWRLALGLVFGDTFVNVRCVLEKNIFCNCWDNVVYIFVSLNLFILFFGCVGSSLLRAGFSLVAASRGYSSLQCLGFSLQCLLLWRTGSRCVGFSSCGSQALEHRHSSCGAQA